jgi:hypothetical protein
MPPIVDEFTRIAKQLYELSPDKLVFDHFTKLASEAPGAQKRVLFEAGAQAVRRQQAEKHMKLQPLVFINKKLAAHIGKYNGYFARLCLLFHCIEHYRGGIPGFIDAGVAERVAEFMQRFLLPHAVAFYNEMLNLSEDHDRLAAVAGAFAAGALSRVGRKMHQRPSLGVGPGAMPVEGCVQNFRAAGLQVINRWVHEIAL